MNLMTFQNILKHSERVLEAFIVSARFDHRQQPDLSFWREPELPNECRRLPGVLGTIRA